MKKAQIYFLGLLLIAIASCSTPKLGVLARVDGQISAPKNQTELDDVRLALYITDYISRHAKVFDRSDYGKHTLQLLVVDAQGLHLIGTDENTSPALEKYLKRLFASNNFKPPLDARYQLGETIAIKIVLEHS